MGPPLTCSSCGEDAELTYRSRHTGGEYCDRCGWFIHDNLTTEKAKKLGLQGLERIYPSTTRG